MRGNETTHVRTEPVNTGTAGVPPAAVGQGPPIEDAGATLAGETPAVPVKRSSLWVAAERLRKEEHYSDEEDFQNKCAKNR
jgi:hypothetical protein